MSSFCSPDGATKTRHGRPSPGPPVRTLAPPPVPVAQPALKKYSQSWATSALTARPSSARSPGASRLSPPALSPTAPPPDTSVWPSPILLNELWKLIHRRWWPYRASRPERVNGCSVAAGASWGGRSPFDQPAPGRVYRRGSPC